MGAGVHVGKHVVLLAGAGILAVDKEMAINRLSGRSNKRTERIFDQTALADFPILVNDKRVKDSLGRRAEVNLREKRRQDVCWRLPPGKGENGAPDIQAGLVG